MATSDPTPASETPKYIGVECHICGTLMYGRPEHVGRKLKCPDCGARTVLPPPRSDPKKNTPPAMEGEQYELWEADEQPLPAEVLATQPKYIAIECGHCQTLMYATEQQVGQTIACPDCGKPHLVPKPVKPKAKRSVLARDADTPKLDPNAALGERPSPVSKVTRPMSFEEEADAAYARAKEESLRTGRPMKIDVRGRPVMPRFPLLSGILPFPFYAGSRERWAALTFSLLIPVGLILDGIPAWLDWAGDWGGALEAMGGLAETMIGGVLAIVWLAAASNILIAIVSQSAVGNDRIAEWPPLNFIASMSEMLPVTVAVIFTAAPGWMFAKFLALPPAETGLCIGVTTLLGFPVVLLSQLSGNSTWELVELKVLGAMIRCPVSMTLVYIESALLAALCVWAAAAAADIHFMMPLALAPLYVGCLILYARILGRLAWRLSEKMGGELGS